MKIKEKMKKKEEKEIGRNGETEIKKVKDERK